MTWRTLAVDVGQTGARLYLAGPDGTHTLLRGPGYQAGAGAEVAAARAVAAALDRHGVPALELDAAAVGMTGLHGGTPRAEVLAAALADRVRARRLVVADDTVTSYLGSIGDRAGVVTIAGTGAVSLASDGRGRWSHVDGWGALVGDDGGGYWIGRAGIAAALRGIDGRGEPTGLTRRVLDDTGGDPRSLPGALAADPDRVPRIARFAEAVVAQASCGDAVAADVLRRAGTELARSAATAVQRAGTSEGYAAALVGELARGSAHLRAAYGAELRARAAGVSDISVYPGGAALDGARRLLTTDATRLFHGLATAVESPRGEERSGPRT